MGTTINRMPEMNRENNIYKNISVVLVAPQSGGNVGSVARVMKNTGFSNLWLVDPCDYKTNESYSMACKADDVLLSARIFSSVTEVADSAAILVGTTRRMGRARYPVQTLQEALPKIIELGTANKVALLFGREDRGLENDEISACDMLIEIPADENYASFNLSHAVLLTLYHIFSATADIGPVVKATSKDELERMYAHMEEALRSIDYGEKGGEYLLKSIMRSFRRLFGRTALMPKEVNMLRGIFTQIISRAGKK